MERDGCLGPVNRAQVLQWVNIRGQSLLKFACEGE